MVIFQWLSSTTAIRITGKWKPSKSIQNLNIDYLDYTVLYFQWISNIPFPWHQTGTVMVLEFRIKRKVVVNSVLPITFFITWFVINVRYYYNVSTDISENVHGTPPGGYKNYETTLLSTRNYKWILFLVIPLPSSCNATIVTAYFKMRSKHSHEEYVSWMSNMLTLKDCMLIFTQPELVE